MNFGRVDKHQADLKKSVMTDSNIARYFLVDDKNDSGLAQYLLNSGAIPTDIVPADSQLINEEVRSFLCLNPSYC